MKYNSILYVSVIVMCESAAKSFQIRSHGTQVILYVFLFSKVFGFENKNEKYDI